MPTYSYRCTECSTAFDIQQAFTDDSLTECPTCHGRLRKLFSAVGVTFNGSGFYRTDSRSGASKGEGGSSSGDSGGSTSTPAAAPAAASTGSSSGSTSGSTSGSSTKASAAAS